VKRPKAKGSRLKQRGKRESRAKLRHAVTPLLYAEIKIRVHPWLKQKLKAAI
jgi:hypothetical protein